MNDVITAVDLVATAAFALPVAIAAAFLLRACAILFDLRLPKYEGRNG